MNKLVIHGRAPLSGRLGINGAKNAALPIMAGCLLTAEPCVIDNVPMIDDIRTMTDLLTELGCQVEIDERHHRITIEAADIASSRIPTTLATRMRASFLAAGPLLARTGEANAPHPGGCAIGRRPVNVDVNGFARMGAEVRREDGEYVLRASRLTGERLYLDYPSHTGTENILMAAALAHGRTVIKNASAEPEVVDLARFLRKMGARIRGAGTTVIEIDGVPSLRGVHYRVMPDRIEAGTFAIAAAISQGDVTLSDVVSEHMDPLTHKLREVGVCVESRGRDYRIKSNPQMYAVELQTLHYPGFPTDLQAAFGALLTQAEGTSVIHERVYDRRLQYADELLKLGATIRVAGQTATVQGPTPLHGRRVHALDIRCGAALTLAGLAADGTTEILDIHHIDRGYEGIDAKLRSLGARIERVIAG
jgi:UDP-N-acetylglucosamine 1-carboxyvinyltransferase